MALIDNIIDGVAAAVVSGGLAVLATWLGNRGRHRRLDEAWHRQADELDERLRTQYDAEIRYLRRELGACQRETQRLNGLLTQERREPR